ncbi:phosphatidylserine decarboxylase [Allocoprobacillus halotolerans]|uniref:Phosphatidylserine decarboxylase n=1 Tax=Allocoprobacillus halotolerans TaxID=2944914 RepID=A0ABY5I5W0_9FIRM|nr:phosphatidylserine decarboxylase [Allocoprobacillus halotolerans]UTY40744.1 phosphatidylserine decarboxylase [Allocoprobacillus halotolerans]
MKIFDRQGQELKVNQSQNQLLRLLYSHFLGRCALKVLTLPFITYIGGWYMNSRFSKRKIQPFITQNQINMSQYEKQDYCCYNDFFTRKIKKDKRPIHMQDDVLIAPADSKLSYYRITQDTHLKIKDSIYALSDLLQNETLAQTYDGGVCLIFRLTVDDYHRYCFIDDGTKEKDVYIQGVFHTVNPIANDYYPIYKQNSRSYSLLHTKHFDDVIYMEVGAMMVGKIVNHSLMSFHRGDEKGYFEFGGSTIVVLLKKDIVEIDEDIIQNSLNHDETRVLMGERIGIRK